MANSKKLLPYGISSFEKVRLENYYYVDKTAYLRSLEEYNYILFLRPRRFGKSLFVNMLKAYYDVNYADKFDALFGDLAIGKEPTHLRNSYLMLSFGFSGVDSRPENVQESFNSSAISSIERFLSAYKDKLGPEARKKVIEQTPNCAQALKALSALVAEAGYKIYVTIDEYDNFANTLMTVDEASYEKLLHADGFVRFFYNVLKEATTDNQAAIDRIFITGVSPLCLSDVTSGFNIAANISTDIRFNAMVGFTTDEVREMFTYYHDFYGDFRHSVEELLALTKPYYDNYCFSRESAMYSGEHMFNSDMTLYFLMKYNGGYHTIPDSFIDDNVKQDFNKIRMMVRYESSFGNKSKRMQSILNDGYTLATLNTEFQIRELSDEKNLVSLLFYLGLLTYGKIQIDRNGKPFEAISLVVANDTMRRQYGTYLTRAYSETLHWRTDNDTMDDLWINWSYFGQWGPLISYIVSVMQENDSVRDYTPQAESFVKGFLLAHLCKGNGYIARTEAEMGHGYSDIYLYPVNPEYRNALVLELKYLKPSATDTEVKNARKEARIQVAGYIADKRLQTEAEAREWTLAAAVVVFRGWKAEVVEAVE